MYPIGLIAVEVRGGALGNFTSVLIYTSLGAVPTILLVWSIDLINFSSYSTWYLHLSGVTQSVIGISMRFV